MNTKFIVLITFSILLLTTTALAQLSVGSGIQVGGRAVILENVGSQGAIIVSVSGVTETIGPNSIETVNCIPIANQETTYSSTVSERKALLNIGDARDSECISESTAEATPYMSVGESVKLGGRSLTLVNVGSQGAIIVKVVETTETLEPAGIETVGCLPIANNDAVYTENTAERRANINVGDDRSNCDPSTNSPAEEQNPQQGDAPTADDEMPPEEGTGDEESIPPADDSQQPAPPSDEVRPPVEEKPEGVPTENSQEQTPGIAQAESRPEKTEDGAIRKLFSWIRDIFS